MNPDLQNYTFSYMNPLLEEILKPSVSNKSLSSDTDKIAAEIFKILSSREFTYFTRIKCEPYRDLVCGKIVNSYNVKEPLTFCFNLGGGYHARTSGDISFKPGLSEFLAIFQIKKFLDKISNFYPFGVLFEIILDNRCAELTNGIDLNNTIRYSEEFKKIIEKLGLSKEIKIILESDLISRKEFERRIPSAEKHLAQKLTAKDRLNAQRFCGNGHISDETKSVERYKMIRKVSKEIYSGYSKNGICLIQRAMENYFPFRSFPGGDSKIQCGNVALLLENCAVKKPMLITTSNIGNFDLSEIKLPEKFAIPNLLVATRKN